jgi:predicted CoA-binding protein
LDIEEDIDLASLYLPKDIGLKIIEEVSKKHIKEIYLNPGADSEEVIEECKKLGVKPLVKCSIIAIGASPSDY